MTPTGVDKRDKNKIEKSKPKNQRNKNTPAHSLSIGIPLSLLPVGYQGLTGMAGLTPGLVVLGSIRKQT